MTAAITSGKRFASAIAVSTWWRVRSGVVGQPQALQHLHTVPFGDLGDVVEPVVDRIGTDTIGNLLELGQVLIDLPWIDRNIRAERALIPAEGRVREAMEFAARCERRRRHLDRGSKPPPYRHNGRSGDRE